MESLLRAPRGKESSELRSTPLGAWAARVVGRSGKGRRVVEYIGPRFQRGGLVVFGVCFLAVALSVANYHDRPIWSLVVISSLFFGAGVSHLMFALRPCSELLFRLCLAFTMTATASRVLILPVWRSSVPGAIDEWWVALVTLALFVPFAMLYWWFWRTEVLPWHRKMRMERA